VSEIAIFAGLVAIVVWLIRGGTAVLVVGLVVCTLGVLEFTAREHFSGYRSHTTLLAALPAIAISIGLISAVGTHNNRAVLLMLVAAPIFSALFWWLRKRFLSARQARVARPPAP
jgi:exosortase/archaeosortase